MRAALSRAADPVAALEQRLAAVELAVAELQRGRGRGPQDQADAALLVAVAGVVAGTRFSAREVVAHATVAPELAAIFDEAGVGDSPRSLGRVLRRCEGRDVDGWRLERVGMDRDGLVWRVSRVCVTTPEP